MAEFIPCVNTERDCRLLSRHYRDGQFVRVSCDSLAKTHKHLAGLSLWLDAGVDALDRWPSINDAFKEYMSGWSYADRIVDSTFQAKPSLTLVTDFVKSVLAGPSQHSPALLSIPQLPVVAGSERNKVNRQLAAAAGNWRESNRFSGRLVLPVIITHSSQVRLKADRTKRIDLIKQCVDASGAGYLWTVDSTLYDQDGASTLESTRLPSLVAFHEELREGLGENVVVIGGPYWGFHLVLWCRGLIDYPAVGIGNAYQYHLSGGFSKQGKSRIALSPLRRWAVASVQLKNWLEEAIRKLPQGDPAGAELSVLLRQYPQISLDGRPQVASFYRTWLTKLETVPKAGRALAMYQDLSSAYVLGKGLDELPKDEGTARRPERVAKQLMMFCL